MLDFLFYTIVGKNGDKHEFK